jgi:hypothetical protein
VSREHGIQNAIRNALAGVAYIFRANVGTGWASSFRPVQTSRPITVSLQPGDVLLRQARPFSSGLPDGFSDLFGFVPVTVTPDMVGKRVAIFAALEVKTRTGRASDKQQAFLRAVNDNGGRAGVVRSADDALAVVQP